MMNKSYLIAFVFAAAVAGWILSGQVGANDDPAGTTPPEGQSADEQAKTSPPEELVSVRVRVLKAQAHRREIVLRGRTEAVRSVAVKAEIPGVITKIAVKKGARVKAGDLIAKIDMQDRAERLVEAKALARQRQLEYKAAEALSKKGYRAETKLAASMTQLDSAKALVTRIEIEIEHTDLRAPFAGIVDSRPIEIGDYLKVGNPVATIVDQEPYLVVGEVSEREVSYLKIGQMAEATLITGQKVAGKIRFIAKTADPQTRTFHVEVQVPNKKRNLRDGVTAQIRIPVAEVQAHLVSHAVMTLNDEGLIGVKVVDLDGIVHFVPAVIIADSQEGVWLAGLPETVGVIMVGQEFVRDGDKVDPVIEAGPTS